MEFTAPENPNSFIGLIASSFPTLIPAKPHDDRTSTSSSALSPNNIQIVPRSRVGLITRGEINSSHDHKTPDLNRKYNLTVSSLHRRNCGPRPGSSNGTKAIGMPSGGLRGGEARRTFRTLLFRTQFNLGTAWMERRGATLSRLPTNMSSLCLYLPGF